MASLAWYVSPATSSVGSYLRRFGSHRSAQLAVTQSRQARCAMCKQGLLCKRCPAVLQVLQMLFSCKRSVRTPPPAVRGNHRAGERDGQRGLGERRVLVVDTGASVMKCPSPLALLKDTYGHIYG